MCKVQFVSVFVIFLTACCISQCYKILGIIPTASPSHHIIGSTVLKALARKGHQVTAITSYLLETPMKNYREIPVVEMIEAMEEHRKQLFNLGKAGILDRFTFMNSLGIMMSENVFKHPNVQKILNSDEKFDAVYLEYFMNDALMGIANHFNAPLIVVSPLPPSIATNGLVGNPGNSATMTSLLHNVTADDSFLERVKNTIKDTVFMAGREFSHFPTQGKILKKYLPQVPDLEEIRHNVSILLVNSHKSINQAVASVPNMISIGGFHVAPTKQLPEDLKSYLDKATDGAILFSMGSNLKSADLTGERREGILRAFVKIKQKVLWKFEEQLEGLPPNVKIVKWLPQQDILAHPNVVAFITHGGLLSTIETVYFGKPVIGIPVFGDQNMNMAKAAKDGYGVTIAVEDLNEETLTRALNEILNNPKYRNEVQRRSAIMHDRPVKPLDLAVYWVEYAIRHKGAPHLKNVGLKLKWYQSNLLDVYLFLGAILLAVLLVFKVLITKYCCRRNQKTVSDSKKRN